MSISHHIPTNPAKAKIGITDEQRESCQRVVAQWVADNNYSADTAHLLMRMLGVLPNQDLTSFTVNHVERIQWL